LTKYTIENPIVKGYEKYWAISTPTFLACHNLFLHFI
jgi:hypothetical protein